MRRGADVLSRGADVTSRGADVMSRGANVTSRGIYGRHQRQEHCQCNDFCSFIHYDYIFFSIHKRFMWYFRGKVKQNLSILQIFY